MPASRLPVTPPPLPNLLPRTGRRPFPVDVTDHGDEYLVEADLPGFARQHVDVAVRGNGIEIAAYPSVAAADAPAGPLVKRRGGSEPMRRTVTLPEPIDGARSSATISNGLLQVWIPKLPVDVERS